MTAEEITKYIFVEDQDLQGDVALVFGTWKSWEASIEKTAEIYKHKLVPKIIVSGGMNEETRIIEGDFMAKELVDLGVPREDILTENKSTNTLENVLFSREVLEKTIGFGNTKIIIAIVKNFHARRVLMTLKKQMPVGIVFKIAPYISPAFNFTKENWFESDLGRRKVLGEVEKIKKYLKKGDLAEI